MEKKIIIGIAIAVITIIAVIVGIIANNHQKAVKETESISVSVEASKTDLITSYKKQFDEITSKNYTTEEDYTSAKALLESLKNDINNSDIKDEENAVNLVKDIDKSIKDYDEKIKSLTTTEESTTEAEETTTKSNSNEKTTKSNNGYNGGSNNSNKDKPKSTTAKETTKNETTTKKKANIPAYGTTTSSPKQYDCDVSDWSSGRIIYTWDGEYWCMSYGIINHTSESEYIKYAEPACPPPNRDGKYVGEEVSTFIYVWLN